MASAADIGLLVGNRFEIVRPLGTGSSGHVYQGRDRVNRERVAVKLLHRDLLGSEEHVARFFREVEAAEHIEHPGVVRFLSAGTLHDGRPYLVQEFLYGQDMSRALLGGPLPLAEVFEIALQLLDALTAIHAAGLVHRDVKPENLFLLHDEFGGLRVKLVDFGIVKVKTGELPPVTGAGRTVGTPHYMSPEQVQAQEVDGRADLWSAGVVLYEALTGRPPFDHQNPHLLLTRIVSAEAQPIATLRPDLPDGIARVVDRALQRNRDERWQSATAMARALRSGTGVV